MIYVSFDQNIKLSVEELENIKRQLEHFYKFRELESGTINIRLQTSENFKYIEKEYDYKVLSENHVLLKSIKTK